MLHARKDYNKRVQDSEGRIGEEEPVFLLRAKDNLMVPMLYYYLKLLRKFDGYDRETEKGVLRHIERTVTFQEESTIDVHPPDTPKGQLVSA